MGNYATLGKAQLSTDCQPVLPRLKPKYYALIRLQAEQLMLSPFSLFPFSFCLPCHNDTQSAYTVQQFDDNFTGIIQIVLQFVFSENFLCITAGKCMQTLDSSDKVANAQRC